MHLWRQYLEQYAESEGDVEGQILVGANHASKIFESLSLILKGEDRPAAGSTAAIPAERNRFRSFDVQLEAASQSLYAHLKALACIFTRGNPEARLLLEELDRRYRDQRVQEEPAERAILAVRASFPLLSLMCLSLEPDTAGTSAIRQMENRFAEGDARAGTGWEKLVNAVYRLVEMMQIFVVLSDGELVNQAKQIVSRFEEEDRSAKLGSKLRNGFCRLFEFGHLVTTHLDAVLGLGA